MKNIKKYTPLLPVSSPYHPWSNEPILFTFFIFRDEGMKILTCAHVTNTTGGGVFTCVYLYISSLTPFLYKKKKEKEDKILILLPLFFGLFWGGSEKNSPCIVPMFFFCCCILLNLGDKTTNRILPL